MTTQAQDDFTLLLKLFQAYLTSIQAEFENDTFSALKYHATTPPLCVRFTNQYLLCRREYGDAFLDAIYSSLIPLWQDLLERNRQGQLDTSGYAAGWVAVTTIVPKLIATGECLELQDLYAHYWQQGAR